MAECAAAAEITTTQADFNVLDANETLVTKATLPHAHEPGYYERSQIIALRAQPGIDGGVVFHRRWEAQDVVHE